MSAANDTTAVLAGPNDQAPHGPGQAGRQDPEHEAQCRRCGISCHVAVPHGMGRRERLIVVPGLHCRYLAQTADGQWGCTVYEDRFARAPWCHHADVAAPLGYLAHDCPYGSPPGKGKVRLAKVALDAIWPELLWTMTAHGLPDCIAHEPLLAEVQRRQGVAYTLQPWPGDPERLRLTAVRGGP